MAPRISFRLIEAIIRLDDRSRPIAETYRQVGEEAWRLGLTRPSYQRVRELVHQVRNARPRVSISHTIDLLTMRIKTTDEGLERLEQLVDAGIAALGVVAVPRRPP